MEKQSMGTFLTALRKTSGYTQKQLAEKLNVSDKAVSRWERDECAPDLSLIPVLAEIYGVTSDEILRGQRMDPEKLYRGNDQAKTAKQRQRILKSTKTKFICRSLINIAITVAGLILVYILNCELSKGNAGFLIGALFFIAAGISQILILITGLASITDEDSPDRTIEYCRGFMLHISQWVLGINAAAFALYIPLAGKSTISFADWIFAGVQWVFVITAITVTFSIVTNLFLRQKGIIDFNQPLNKLRFRCGTVLALVLVLLVGLQAGMNAYLTSHRHLYAPHDTLISLPSFQERMETPRSTDGMPMYAESVEDFIILTPLDFKLNDALNVTSYRLHEKEITKQLFPSNSAPGNTDQAFREEFGYQFQHLNLFIPYYELSDTPEHLPIYTFNTLQLEKANSIALTYNLIYLLTYAAAVIVTGAIYFHKEKKL